MSTSLLTTARLLGRMRYVELAAFSRLGRRAPTAGEAALAGFLAGASLAHAWRAAQLETHLPVSTTLPGPDELTVSPGPHLEAALDLLDRADDGPLLTALAEVLYPAMLAGYDARRAVASPASDPPLRRTLGRVRHDLAALAEEALALAGIVTGRAHRHPGDLGDQLAALLADAGPFDPIGHSTTHA